MTQDLHTGEILSRINLVGNSQEMEDLGFGKKINQ
jgi:hypothetical protein